MSIFTGAGVALITPMHEDGSINYDEMERIVNYQIENGTDAIIVCGTTGEASTMTHEEHIETIKACVDMTKKRIPVIAGTGSNCTDTAIYLSKEAQRVGADGILVVSPYYNKATQNGLKKHFTAIAGSVDIPMILYNIQGRTGVNIQPKTIASLAKEVENIVAVKEASGDLSQVANIIYESEGRIDVYSGNDDQIMPVLSLGGDGVISTCSNIIPKECVEITDSFFSGDIKTAIQKQLDILPMCDALFCECNPIPVKTAMKIMGLNTGDMRLPLTELTGSKRDLLEKTLKDYSLI